jgi:hypothetical protein
MKVRVVVGHLITDQDIDFGEVSWIFYWKISSFGQIGQLVLPLVNSSSAFPYLVFYLIGKKLSALQCLLET